MKIRLVQKDIANHDLAPFIQAAVADGLELICFGELATTGCLYEKKEVPGLPAVAAALGAFPIRIMLGLPYLDDQGLRNAFVYINGDDVEVYHKANLFAPMNETNMYVAGSETGLWELPFGRVGVAICYDIRIDDYFADLGDQKPGLVVIPAAFPRVRIADWRRLLRERAIQLGCPVLGINAVGNDGTNEFGGRTTAVSGAGEILAEADETSETILDVDI